jgi:hypothetical protein
MQKITLHCTYPRKTLHCSLHTAFVPNGGRQPSTCCRHALLPPELAGCVWTALRCQKDDARKNLFATSRSLQTLLSPSVTALEFKLRQGNDQQYFRGLQPAVQPRRMTVTAAVYSMYDDEYGAYDAPGCHAALCQFIPALSLSPHANRLEHLALKVGALARLRYTAMPP